MTFSPFRAHAWVSCTIAGAALLLAGCFTQNVSKDFQFKPNPTQGLAFASVTVSGERPMGLFMRYRKVGGKGDIEMQQIPVINSLVAMDWDPKGSVILDPRNPAGRMMAIELPPGRYEFYSWHGTIPGYSVWSTTPFSYQFEVVAGRATYVGNMHLHFADQRRYRMGLLNSQERDMPLVRQKIPKVPEDQIGVQLMESVQVAGANPSPATK